MKFLFLIPFFVLISLMVQAQEKVFPVYKNPKASVEVRVHDLLGRMSLMDKCKQLDIWHANIDASKPDSLKLAIKMLGDTIKDGIGFLQFEVQMNRTQYASRFNAIQKYFVEQTRLGIPAISNGEGCHGFVGNDDQSTVFPVAPLLGSTWDTLLIENVYKAVAK